MFRRKKFRTFQAIDFLYSQASVLGYQLGGHAVGLHSQGKLQCLVPFSLGKAFGSSFDGGSAEGSVHVEIDLFALEILGVFLFRQVGSFGHVEVFLEDALL